MFKVVALLALVAFALAQQDMNSVTSTATTELAGVPSELAGVVDQGLAELVRKVSLQPTQAQLDTIRAAAMASPEFAGLAALAAMTADQVAAVRDNLAGNISLAKAAYDAYKAELVANLTDAVTRWRAQIANMTENRDLAVTDARSLLERAKAVLIYHLAKIAQRQIAAELVALKATGQRIELGFRFLNATVFLLNNVIAAKNGSNVGGVTWTLVNATTLQAKVLELYIAVRVADWALDQVRAFVIMVSVENIAAVNELVQRVKAFAKKVYEAVDELRSRWKATAAPDQTLAEHIQAFLENVTNVQVTITGLDGPSGTPITVTVTVTRDDLPTDIRSVIEAAIVKRINALLIAYAGQDDSGVTTVPGTKRAVGTYTVKSTITGSGSGASTLALSALAVGAAVVVALRH